MNLAFLKYFFLAFCYVLCLGAIASEDYLPKTIIFKVKKEHRARCFDSYIKEEKFEKLAGQIQLEGLAKVFPAKTYDKTLTKTDLSLIYQLTYNADLSVLSVVSRMKKLSVVAYAEPYFVPKLTYIPNDSTLQEPEKSYHLGLVNAYAAWDIQRGNPEVVVGITDTGWEPGHPDLMDNVKTNNLDTINGIDDDGDGYVDNFLGWDLGNEDNNALYESLSHGVQVTGLAAAVTDNLTGVASIGFNTSFLPIKISNSSGVLTHAYQGIVYAADHGCFIINCSWGSYSSGQFQQDVIDYAVKDNGCLVVAAVGNDAEGLPFYPAAYPGVLAVASSNEEDLKADFSNYGYHVDVSAPGVSLWSTSGNNGYRFNGGTSLSAPLISGAAALIKAQFPSYTNQQVAALIKTTADSINIESIYQNKMGKGRLNAFEALSESTPKYVDLVAKSINDNDNNYRSGDTLTIVGEFINYLSPLSDVAIRLTSHSPYAAVVDESIDLGAMQTLERVENLSNPFKVLLLEGGDINEEVIFSFDITAENYRERHFFSITTNSNYVNIVTERIATTVANDGRIGFDEANNGKGFVFQNKQLLFDAGMMLGDREDRVADRVRTVSGARNDKLESVISPKVHPPYVSDIDVFGIFKDTKLLEPLDVLVRQKTYAYYSSPNDNYVVFTYLIENSGDEVLANLHAGIFADWDILDPHLNKASYDATRKMGFVYSVGEDSLYGAIKLLSNGVVHHYAIDHTFGGAGGVDILNDFSMEEKYLTLSTDKASAGGENGRDVSHVVSTEIGTLFPGENRTLAFALIAGESLSDIQQNADIAQAKYMEDGLIQNLYVDNDIIIYPNPTSGRVYLKTENFITSVEVRNVYGQTIANLDVNTYDIDFSGYESGIYILYVTTSQSESVHKVLVR